MRSSRARLLSSLSVAGVYTLGLAFALLAAARFAAVPVAAQLAPANAVTVKLLDPIDSVAGVLGQRYHAAVAKDTAIGGVFLAKGAPATITLAAGSNGSRWTLTLIELTVNGKVAGVFGQNPAVVPTGAGDFMTMSKKTITTKDRIAVAAGENIRFLLGPANGQAAARAATAGGTAVPAPPAGTRPATPAAVPAAASAGYRNAPVAGPKPGENTFIGPYGAVLYGKYLHIEVRLDGCTRQATASSSCDFSIWDRNPPQQIGMSIGGFGVVDNKGQVVSVAGEGAKCCDGRNRSVIVPGVVSHAHYTYAGLDPDVTSLVRVSIKIYEAGTGGNDEFEFRNVPLGVPAANPQAFTPNPKLPTKLVAEDNGWRISVARCSYYVRKSDPGFDIVECFFKVENLKADRDLVAFGTSHFVDEHGNSHDNVWYPSGAASRSSETDSIGMVGDAAEYARIAQVPEMNPAVPGYGLDARTFNQPDIKYGVPRYMFAVFSVVPKDVKHIEYLEFGVRQGSEFRNFSVSFNDIPLTPMPTGKPGPLPRKVVCGVVC